MPDSRGHSAQHALDQIAEMDKIAACILKEPQRSIWHLMCEGATSPEITEILNASKREGEAPITEQRVRYHRAKAQIAVREKYTDFRQGKFWCGVVVERGDDATLKADMVAQEAICNADRCHRKAA